VAKVVSHRLRFPAPGLKPPHHLAGSASTRPPRSKTTDGDARHGRARAGGGRPGARGGGGAARRRSATPGSRRRVPSRARAVTCVTTRRPEHSTRRPQPPSLAHDVRPSPLRP
jgi:hypothetical protein